MADSVASRIDPVLLTAQLVAAFVEKNSIPASDVAKLLGNVHAAVASLIGGAAEAPASAPAAKASSAQIRKSITPDALISFVDGKPYKTLKRHLRTHGLDVASYRARYGLPDDYPTVAASYSATRSALARSLGLGNPRQRSPRVAAPATVASSPLADRPKRGRPTKKRV